jgi:DNA-directed RNA polymerase specialized sigma24 family protein/tetratricopeptide (TPR) repeat protein
MNQDSTQGDDSGGEKPARTKLRTAIERDAKEVAEFASACLPVRGEGDAILREVFVSAYEDAVSSPGDPFSRARLFGKARRLCARATERRRKEPHDSSARDRELGSRQRAMIAELRPTEREALLLKYVARLSDADLAEACATDEATARLRVSSAVVGLVRATKGHDTKGGSAPSPEVGARRKEVEEKLSEILDGLAQDDLADFVAEDDVSRDLVHDAERVVELVRALEADHEVDRAALFEHVVKTVEVTPAGGSATPERPGTVTAPMGAVVPAPEAVESVAGQAAEAAGGGEPSAPAEPAAGSSEPTASKDSEKESKESEPKKDDPSSGETKPWSERLGQRGRLGVALGVAAFIGLVAFLLSRSQRGPSEFADAAWAGKIADVSRAFGGGSGLERCSPEGSSCSPAERGDDMPAGSTLRTDGQTRAIVELKDGSRVWLDRGSELGFDGDSARRARLVHGRAIVEVSDLGASRARIDSALGFVETSGTKASLTVDPDAFGVEVARGSVRLIDTNERGVAVHAGEEGRLEPGQPPEVSASAYLGNAFRWSERTFTAASADETALAGLGELRAKKPGEDQERKGAVQLASHSTKVRIVGNVARTEIEEVFANSADEVLEGIYRFPLPPDAQIERLALDVDGKLEEGAFVDRERAGAIWRGAIVNAGGKKPVAEEIVWVRGPWRDPALLEWQRGGRFELRIYPIPKHGSRRVILAYTQVIPPSGKVRRYVYPLPHDPSGSTRVGRFDVDAEIRGLDAKAGVVARGYEMQTEALPEGGKKLRLSKEGFVANGDLSIEFALPNPNQEVTAWAYEPGPDEVSAERTALTSPSGGSGAPIGFSQPANVGAPFAAVALRPKLPRAADDLHRAFAIVVDSSRSMFGERYRRAVELASRLVQEMDRGDHATVLACDSTCRELPSGAALALGDRARTVRDFLMGVTPEGASDVAGAIRHARETLRGAPNGSGRIVYIGDGTPTVGAVQPAFVRREIGAAVPREFGTVTTVAVGTDADVGTLRVLAESAGGVMLPYTPGQGVAEAVYAVLGATYGSGLADVEIDVPDGLVDVTPRRLATIPAGGEAIFTARMTRPSVEGTLRVRGRVGGAPFEQRYPIRVEATTAKGNAFVPRLYAAMKIADLEDQPDAESRKRAVDLSGRYHVASRYTSLLVLESAAMFKAFGLDQSERGAAWTGEDEAKSTGAEGELAMADDEGPGDFDAKKDESRARNGGPGVGRSASATSGGAAMKAGVGYAEPASAAAPKAKAPAQEARKPYPAKRSFDFAEGESARREAYAPPRPAPAPANPYAAAEAAPGAAPSPMPSSPAGSRPRELTSDLGTAYEMRPPPPPPPPRFRYVPMRKVWERVGHIVTPPSPPAAASPDAIAQAERAVQENDLKREAVKKLYTLYFLSGDIQRASSVAERWSEKDPLDPDALTARADVAAARGDRDLAIRILGSVVDVRPGDHKAQWRLARLNRWAGRAELGCRFSMAVAQIRTGDAKLIVEAVRCARDIGHAEVAGDLMSGADTAARRIIDSLLGEAPQDPSALSGDFRLEARWDGGDDLDLAMLHQEGRMSWLGAPTKAIISARDVQSTSREALALRGGSVGDYVVEITRPVGHSGVVRGTVDISAPGGDRRSVPFVLDGERVRVALVKVTARSKLVPL